MCAEKKQPDKQEGHHDRMVPRGCGKTDFQGGRKRQLAPPPPSPSALPHLGTSCTWAPALTPTWAAFLPVHPTSCHPECSPGLPGAASRICYLLRVPVSQSASETAPNGAGRPGKARARSGHRKPSCRHHKTSWIPQYR